MALLLQVPGDVVSYSSVVSACARAAQWTQALELFRTQKEADEAVALKTKIHIIYNYYKIL